MSEIKPHRKYRIPFRATQPMIPITEETRKAVLRVLDERRERNQTVLFEKELGEYV